MARRRQLSDDQYNLRDVMNTLQGRAVICGLLEQMGYWVDGFNADPYVHAQFSGARRIAVSFVEQLEREFFDQWVTLQRERNARQYNTQTREEDDDGHNDNDE